MSAARLLRRMTGRGRNPVEDGAASEESVLTRPPRSRPVPRTLGHWCLILSLALMSITAVWLAAAGTSVARAAGRVASVQFRAPVLEDYLATRPGGQAVTNFEVPPMTSMELSEVNLPVKIEAAFNAIRQFENSRAEFRLGKLKSVVASVMAGSPSHQGGLQRGDELLSIWGKPATTVWEFLSAVAANGGPAADVEFRRGEVVYRTKIQVSSGAQIDLANIGLSLDMPEGVRYVGPGDARRLAEDFIRGYVESIPPDWRKIYGAGLESVMSSLARRTEDQKARPAQDPAYLRSELILVWYHEAFIAEIERVRLQSSEATQVLSANVAALGRASAAVATTLLLSLMSYAMYSRSRSLHRGRS